MPFSDDELLQGARNLLIGCAGARRGETLLIVRENPAHGYYDRAIADAVERAAHGLGLVVRGVEVPFEASAETLPPAVAAAMRGADHTLFLARLGDQLRFRAMPDGARAIVSYALDASMLASPFGRAEYAAFVALKAAFNDLFARAADIHVTCPLGTDFRGRMRPPEPGPRGDVSIQRFPMSVFAPLPAADFSGRVAVAHFLVGTGSKYYAPYGIELAEPVAVRFGGNRILAWEGPECGVARAERHYAHVASLFGIDRDFIHSWHAGIHPGCAYPMPAAANFERWSGGAFGNPRLAHFHTCGAYAPGEICWNIVDPTIRVDGTAIWRDGRILIDRVPGTAAILDQHPDIRALYDAPAQAIGIG